MREITMFDSRVCGEVEFRVGDVIYRWTSTVPREAGWYWGRFREWDEGPRFPVRVAIFEGAVMILTGENEGQVHLCMAEGAREKLLFLWRQRSNKPAGHKYRTAEVDSLPQKSLDTELYAPIRIDDPLETIEDGT